MTPGPASLNITGLKRAWPVEAALPALPISVQCHQDRTWRLVGTTGRGFSVSSWSTHSRALVCSCRSCPMWAWGLKEAVPVGRSCICCLVSLKQSKCSCRLKPRCSVWLSILACNLFCSSGEDRCGRWIEGLRRKIAVINQGRKPKSGYQVSPVCPRSAPMGSAGHVLWTDRCWGYNNGWD